MWKHVLYVRDKCKIGAIAKSVLIDIASRANEAGECFPSIGRIADDTGWSERSVMRAIKECEEAGLLAVDRDAQKLGNRYFVVPVDKSVDNVDGLVTDSHHLVTDSHPTSDCPSPELVTGSHPKYKVKKNSKLVSKCTSPVGQTVHNLKSMKSKPKKEDAIAEAEKAGCDPEQCEKFWRWNSIRNWTAYLESDLTLADLAAEWTENWKKRDIEGFNHEKWNRRIGG